MISGKFRKGQSGNPAGKPKGAKDHYPRSAKHAVTKLLEDFGNDVDLIGDVLRKGLTARAPSSFPYLKLVIEQNAGAPDANVNLVTKIVHEHRPS